jgi:hypothetical protein
VTPNTNPTDAHDIAVKPCEDCTSTTRWERRDLTPSSEAWLGTCEICGSMQVLALGAPEEEIEDPLAFFLLGTTTPRPTLERPAWQRFYTLTTGAPYFLRWNFETTSCESCQATATVGTHISSPAWNRSLSLCLNCGHTTIETTNHLIDATPIRLTGKQWTPPDPGVKTLRATIIETYRRWAAHQERRRRRTGED